MNELFLTGNTLEGLGLAPRYRGCFDSIDSFSIQGWCIDGENPLKPVLIEIYVEDICIGSTITNSRRTDIESLVQFPLKAGFVFEFDNLPSANIDRIAKKLHDIVHNDYTEIQISGIIHGTNFTLNKSFEFAINKDALKNLFESVMAKQKSTTNNRIIHRRERLIKLNKNVDNANLHDINIIAYYLPQFHPIPENNEWWGEGFTEWTSVSTSQKYFNDHYQPRVPSDLGYYDLRVKETQDKQVEIAAKYGISGFCYYYYWFSGKSMLTLPIERHYNSGYNFKYCLCWANENWSRRWDGSESEILLSQDHTLSDDILFIDYVIKYFKDDRYIKINGAPLLQIYKISLLKDPINTINIWRDKVKNAGFSDLHICMVKSFDLSDPDLYGADSCAEFPPHGICANEINHKIESLDTRFSGKIYDYFEVFENELKKEVGNQICFRGAMPSWDNTSRKKLGGNIFHNSNPDTFEAWMLHLINETYKYDSEYRYIFINAWNEWSEGAHLEPDRKFGHNNLKAVLNALTIGKLSNDFTASSEQCSMSLVSTLNTLKRSNDMLLDIIKSNKITASPSCFIQKPSTVKISLKNYPNAKYNIEMFAGKTNFVFPITVSDNAPLRIKGWIYINSSQYEQKTPLFVGFKSNINDDLYFASVDEKLERRDVSESVRSCTDNNMWGFRLTSHTYKIIPGCYTLCFYFADNSSQMSLFEVETMFTVCFG